MGALVQWLEPELGHRTVDQKGKPGRQFASEPGGNPAPLDLSGDISEGDAAEQFGQDEYTGARHKDALGRRDANVTSNVTSRVSYAYDTDSLADEGDRILVVMSVYVLAGEVVSEHGHVQGDA